MKHFKGYPRAYKRNALTKLLWLSKCNIITYTQYTNSKIKLMEEQ